MTGDDLAVDLGGDFLSGNFFGGDFFLRDDLIGDVLRAIGGVLSAVSDFTGAEVFNVDDELEGVSAKDRFDEDLFVTGSTDCSRTAASIFKSSLRWWQ